MKIHRKTNTTGFIVNLNHELQIETILVNGIHANIQITDDAEGYDIVSLNREQLEFFRDLLSHTIERLQNVE